MKTPLCAQYPPAPWQDLPAETVGVMKRMSGRVSGLLDDLSETMTLLHDLMPSKASELVRLNPEP